MNKDNYKNAVNQIHASSELKEKTIRKMKQNKSNKISYIKILSSVAVVVLVFSIGLFEFNKFENQDEPNPKTVAITKNDLPRFKNINELKEVLEKDSYSRTAKSVLTYGVMNEVNQLESAVEDSAANLSEKKSDYSTTNVQVENVDEADIVKTDGEYIYYVTGNRVLIVNAKELEIVSSIEINQEKSKFNPRELFINNDKLIVLGNYCEYEENVIRDDIATPEDEAESKKMAAYSDYVGIRTTDNAKAIVYDISNKQDLKVVREVSLDGNYMNSRMIGDNIFFISRKTTYYYDGMKDDEILPIARDSVQDESKKIIEAADIAYFKGTDDHSFMLVGGFNINNNDEMSVETFFGASQDVYASENNLYLTQTVYDDDFNASTTIYKFELSIFTNSFKS